jgi:hypothetical protein
MDDLSANYPLSLCPTSQSGGNTAHGNGLAMTAPGSPPIDAMPAPNENLPLPVLPAPPMIIGAPPPDYHPAAETLGPDGWKVAPVDHGPVGGHPVTD